MTFNSEIKLSDLVLVGGGILAFVKIFLANRDIARDLIAAVGLLTKRVDKIEIYTEEHREWLLSNGLDRRHEERRRRDSL